MDIQMQFQANGPSADQAGRSAEPAASDSWVHEADVNDHDAPYLGPLLTGCFRRYAADYEQSEECLKGVIVLYSPLGYELSRTGELPDSAERMISDCVERAIGSGSAEERVHADAYGEEYMLRALPIRTRKTDRLLAVLAFCVPSGGDPIGYRAFMRASSLHFRMHFYAAFEQKMLQQVLAEQKLVDKESQRKDALFQVAKRLHDQIDVPSVLKETIRSLETLYPHSEVDLFLSQDYATVDARVKPLIFRHAANDICARAFLEGKPVKENGDAFKLAVPLSGKQAVYGVLLLTTSAAEWDDADLPAFTMLAGTAGSAFENAKLYEQSNLLIGELQVINELTKRLNQSLRLKEIFQFATTELLQVFQAEFCCVLQLNKETNDFVVMSSNIAALNGERFSAQYGFCGLVYQSKESIIISDYKDAHDVESKLMEMTASRSLIASPIIVGGEVGGVILVTHRNANYFSYDNYKLLQVLSTHIGLAITNASLHAEVRRMVITDNLTGLHARHYLNEQIQLRQRKDPCGSLILVDIDYFKRVNDTFGHQIGDRILMQVSNVIKTCIRDSDIAARWGGEELAVYLPKVKTEQAYRIADRIRSRVESETNPGVTASCGVSEWTFEDEKISPESLFYRADMALYEAKNNGRNQVFVG
jgi:diguanylate cyclase (GGDEF)-like protein